MIDNREHRFISAVAYIQNDSRYIEQFLRTLNEVFSASFQKYEIICVNDGSTDDSHDIIQRIASEFEDTVISIINMGFTQGLELSMNAGEDLAIGDFVYEFDSVFIDYDPECIKNIYDHAIKGYDLVSASPNQKPKKSSALFYRIFNRFSNTNYKLQTERFRLLSRRALNRIFSINQAVLYRKAVIANCGLKMDTIKYPVSTKNRDHKAFTRERRHLATDSLILFTDVGYKLSLFMSLFMMIAVLGIGIYTAIVYISGNPVEGWTPIMLFLAIGFFGLFGILTVCLKYLSLILSLIFKKQRYVIEGIEKVKK